MNKNFTVSFSGKNFTEESHPASLKIIAPTQERAKEWAALQLKQWRLVGVDVKVEEIVNG